jgi:hypothetical protein
MNEVRKVALPIFEIDPRPSSPLQCGFGVNPVVTGEFESGEVGNQRLNGGGGDGSNAGDGRQSTNASLST